MEEKTFSLTIKRSSQATGAALISTIKIGNQIHDKLKVGQAKTYTLPMNTIEVVIYHKVFLGREVKKQFIIDPAGKPNVTVCFEYKMNWIAILPPLCFMMPTSKIITTISYK